MPRSTKTCDIVIDVELFVYENGEVRIGAEGVADIVIPYMEDASIEGLLKTFIHYNVIDITYPHQDVKQEALIKPILLRNIQDRIRREK